MTWDHALKDLMRAYADDQIVWGFNDCCRFVAMYVAALTGRDYGKDFHYASEAQALAILEQYGGMVGLFRELLGPPKDTPDPGDVVIARLPAAMAAGVWCGDWIIGVLPERGVTRYQAHIVGAWSCLPPSHS